MLAGLILSSFLAISPAFAKRCNVQNAALTPPAGLAPPSAPTSFIAVAIGTQNYTCDSTTGRFVSAGAVAELFDISCLYGTPKFSKVQDIAYTAWKAVPRSVTPQAIIKLLGFTKAPEVLGPHYFVPNPVTGVGISPKWDFTSQGVFKGNPNAFVIAARVAGISAPTGPQDIDWLSLKQVTGSLATQVYRVDTRGGQPPASCTGAASITVKYASKYWLFGSSV